MTVIAMILAMGPMSAAGIYNPEVMRNNKCIAEPGSMNALYCKPQPEKPRYSMRKKR